MSRTRRATAHRGWLAAGLCLLAFVGCGGGSTVSVGEPGQPTGPVIGGVVSMPNGLVAAAPSALERVAQVLVARVEALVAGNVQPVVGGVSVTLLEIGEHNVVDGQIQGGRAVFRATTSTQGQYSVILPTDTNPNTCRFVLEVGSAAAHTLTRAFVDAQQVNIDFQSEAAVRLILAQIKAHATTLCSLDANQIASIANAVRASPNTVLGDSAAAVNSSAEVAAAADPGVQAAIAAAIGAPTPVPSETNTAPPSATPASTSTATLALPTVTGAPPTLTPPAAPTHTATNTPAISVAPSRTPTTTATNSAAPTATAITTPTATTPPTATGTAASTATATPASTFTPLATNTATHAPTNTLPPTATSTVAAGATDTALSTATITALPTGTVAATNTATPVATGTTSATASSTAGAATATSTPPSTTTATPPATNTPASTQTTTMTPAATSTASATATSTPASTTTATPPATNTPASTHTATATAAATATITLTNTATSTSTPANTATRTAMNTATSTNTAVASTATSTPTKTAIPTPTNTVPVCPLTAGRYIQTTVGGALKVATFASFVFPAGGTTIQDVGAGDANCVHQTVIPFPGGLSVPLFCVPALNATTSVVQSGCGIGLIDSNGGSDFTVTEQGDTSEATICGPSFHQTSCPPAGPAPDSNGLLTVKVGNGVADTCTSGTANAIVSIPVNTMTWVGLTSSDTCDVGSGFCVIQSGASCTSNADCVGNVICPDTAANGGNGMYDPGTETLLAQFPQTLDLTTDAASASFVDQGDFDGCKKSGLGPNSYAGAGSNGVNSFCLGTGSPSACCTGVNTGTCTGPTGTCIDIGAQTVTVAGGGTIFSTGAPTYDLLFATVQNSTLAGPTPGVTPATCDSPPQINFTGTVSRCVSP